MSPLPNEAHAMDAPIAPLFAIVYQWRRATEQRRSAKNETSGAVAVCC
jgi:hypothetical protein